MHFVLLLFLLFSLKWINNGDDLMHTIEMHVHRFGISGEWHFLFMRFVGKRQWNENWSATDQIVFFFLSLCFPFHPRNPRKHSFYVELVLMLTVQTISSQCLLTHDIIMMKIKNRRDVIVVETERTLFHVLNDDGFGEWYFSLFRSS